MGYWVFYAFIYLIIFFGLILVSPGSTHDESCTYELRPLLQNQYIKISYPVWSSRHCK